MATYEFETTVEFDTSELSDEDLIAEMKSRNMDIPADRVPPFRDAVTDCHENLCGPKYGQPLHSCPDPICRDAVKALEEFD